MNKIKSEEWYRQQVEGLWLIMNQEEGMVHRNYVKEKLQMILANGIGFHSSIKEKLKVKKTKCTNPRTCIDIRNELIKDFNKNNKKIDELFLKIDEKEKSINKLIKEIEGGMKNEN